MGEEFKKWWYWILLVASASIVLSNIEKLDGFEKLNSIELIFIVSILLFLLPLFSEFEILGIKLKKELEKTKSELSGQIDRAFLTLESKISNTNNNYNINGFNLPIEVLIELFQNHFKNASGVGSSEVVTTSAKEEEDSIHNSITQSTDSSIDDIKGISERAVYFFKVRYSIENLLTKISSGFLVNRVWNVSKILETLVTFKIISVEQARLIREIFSIVNRGIHGETVSDEYYNFIRDNYPDIEKYLAGLSESVPSKFKDINACSRCNSVGPTVREGYCMKCGFNNDDW
ncbi:MAG: hypothetical protein C0602_12435 [Denitrovibrio sp.]|nr:MAG: hypothetical protein C0602_12435 [Denitrovibrio sp.]